MKQLNRFVGLFLLNVAVHFSYAQGHPAIGQFTAKQAGSEVFIEWSVVAGNTCAGIGIYRSADSVNFVEIGSIGGICGSVTETLNYDFTDTDPVNHQRNYYRLDLGFQDFTHIVAIDFIDVSGQEYLISPHPVTDISRIYFENVNEEAFIMHTYSLGGALIMIDTTDLGYFQMISGSVPAGIYFFAIQNSEGKLIARGEMVFAE